MSILPQQEQAVDTWLASHNLPRDCPACGSDQRRIDLNPPTAGSWRAKNPDPSGGGSRYKPAGTSIDRVEITCLNCASVRIFDAEKMGL